MSSVLTQLTVSCLRWGLRWGGGLRWILRVNGLSAGSSEEGSVIEQRSEAGAGVFCGLFFGGVSFKSFKPLNFWGLWRGIALDEYQVYFAEQCRTSWKWEEYVKTSVAFPYWLSWWRICLQCGWPGLDLRARGDSPGALEKKMATHSSICAWRIPWAEEPGGLPGDPQSLGSQRAGHDWTRNTHTRLRFGGCCKNDLMSIVTGGMQRKGQT